MRGVAFDPFFAFHHCEHFLKLSSCSIDKLP